jgi:hypothetical protein
MVNAGATGDMPSRAASTNRRSVMAAPSPTDPVARRPVSGIQLSDGVYVSRPVSAGGSGGGTEGFMVAEKSGWLEKKGKRRWFVLTAGEFAWYDGPRQHQKGEKPNGSILAKDASVAQIGEIGNGTVSHHRTRVRTHTAHDTRATPHTRVSDTRGWLGVGGWWAGQGTLCLRFIRRRRGRASTCCRRRR